MTLKNYLYSKVLILLSIWWGWTVLVDFFVIPTVFRNIDSFFTAGNLGILVFSKLNGLELIVSSFILGFISFHLVRNRKGIILLIISVLLWLTAMTYFFYLTPKITELTELWQQADLIGLTGLKGIPDLQQAHQFYHRLYITIDTVKLILLSVMMSVMVIKKEKWF